MSVLYTMLASTAAPADVGTGPSWAGLILLLPALSTLLCGLCMVLRIRNKLPGAITVVCLGASFFVTLALYLSCRTQDGIAPVTVHLFEWFDLSWGDDTGGFFAAVALYVDSLTLLWMLFVTGLGTLIALYATEYMEADVKRGYGRFFAGVSIFLLAMSCLVMGDNLVLLYLGWEGVGFASYWLIGYYYQKPSAVAAAKKAFIMNRIGDFGLALGIYLIYHNFGTVRYDELFAMLAEGGYATEAGGWSIQAIPFLLMLGAFGKSAQIPLFVWLPDAMEGPTPVSALIHAATMVTAGVYLLCRMFPVMGLHEAALPTVAWIGGATALLAATIGMAQYDIKRIMAYSTVSQLGYMFMGIGVMTTVGAAYHVFTHAFFKAVLFLTCGAIMHGFAGQLDLRRLSGLRKMDGWRITSYTMLIGCLCLAGFPFTSGFFSKDMIIAEAFVTPGPGFAVLGWMALATAGLTAYYTFRVWFRVCAGEVHYEMGDEHHGDDDHDDHDDHGHDHHAPHAPRLAINLVLILITAGAILAVPYLTGAKGWVTNIVGGSSAAVHAHGGEHHSFLGGDPHAIMPFVAGGVGLIGIAIAWWFHLGNRAAADKLRGALLAQPVTRWLPVAMENKWYVDEVYHAFIRLPLWGIGKLLGWLDLKLVDEFIVNGIGKLPRRVGTWFQPLQNGILQAYAVSMAGGVALVALLVLYMTPLAQWFRETSVGQWLVGVMGGIG